MAELTQMDGPELRIESTKSPSRVLIVRTGALGDALHAMPAVAAVRKLRPDWQLRWAIEPQWSPLLAAGLANSPGLEMPLVDGWFRVEARDWKRAPISRSTLISVMQLRRSLKAEQFDVAVDMQGLIRSAVVGKIASAQRFVGRAEPRESLAKFFYSERVPVAAPHVVEQGCELLGAAVGLTLKPAKISLPVDVAAEVWCDGVVPDRKFVLMAPTAGWGAKAWPAERYGAVAATLVKAGYAVLVNAASEDDRTAKVVVRTSGGAAVTVPCSIGQMIALVRRASLFMAGDSGPLHLAAALERPVVGIFGPTDPARTGPYGAGVRFPGAVLRDASSVTDHARRSQPETGLLRIGVEQVTAAAFAVLGEAGF